MTIQVLPTKTLKGLALNYAIIMVYHPDYKWGVDFGEHAHSKQLVIPKLPEPERYSPYASDTWVGKLIQDHQVCVDYGDGSFTGEKSVEAHVAGDGPLLRSDEITGPDLVTAVLRAIVVHKFGNHINIPEELT